MNPILNQCRAMLNRLDDTAISSFCLDYFEEVFDMFASGTLRTDKIELLLNYCRQNNQLDLLLQRLNQRQKEQEARYSSTRGNRGSYTGYTDYTDSYRGHTGSYRDHTSSSRRGTNRTSYRDHPRKPEVKMRQIRHGLLEMFPHDTDFMAFCFDYFPTVHSRFGSGQQKTSKITMLLDYCRRSDNWMYLAKSLAEVKG